MALFEFFGKRPAPNISNPFDLDFTIHPLRLNAHHQDYIVLSVALKNISNEEQLTSFIVAVPRGLGFEATGLSQQKEIRFGHLKPSEEKKFTVNIYSNQRTAPGSYLVKLYAASHYRNYGYLVNELKKEFFLRAV